MKIKLFNFRPLLLAFISLLLGILIVHYAYSALPIAVCIFTFFIGLVIFYSIKHKKVKYFIISFLLLVIGGVGFFCQVNSYVDLKEYTSSVVVEGEVIDFDAASYVKLIVDNAKINGKKINAKVSVSYYGEDVITNELVGSIIKFDSYTIYAREVELGNEKTYFNVYSKIKYSTSCYKIEKIKECNNPRNFIKDRVRTNLHKGLSNENAELMFSAIFGDKTFLSDSLYNRYQLSGVVHILAVSGLHVGLIVACLGFIFKLIKCNKILRIFLYAIVLAFYSYLSNFSPPVVRASIMALILLFSSLCYRQYDSLSSISLAGIIILLLTPSTIFSASFLMSFVAVIGIIMLNPTIDKTLEKLKIKNKFSSTFGMSFAVNFALIPVMPYFFSEFNFTGLIANVFILPIFSIIFCIVFVLVMASVIMPFIAISLTYINPFINVITFLASYFSVSAIISPTLSFSLITMIIFIIAIFVSTKFCVIKPKYKLIYTSICLTILLGLMLIDRYVYLL